jgi:G3E family GTPase
VAGFNHDETIMFSVAGSTLTFEPAGLWLAASSKQELADPELEEYLGKVWEQEFGDRRQELVFIGVEMDRRTIEAKLHSALLIDREMEKGPEAWRLYNNPFAALSAEREISVEV